MVKSDIPNMPFLFVTDPSLPYDKFVCIVIPEHDQYTIEGRVKSFDFYQ